MKNIKEVPHSWADFDRMKNIAPLCWDDIMIAPKSWPIEIYMVSKTNSMHPIDQGPELQCLLKVKEDLSYVLNFQDAKNNVSN